MRLVEWVDIAGFLVMISLGFFVMTKRKTMLNWFDQRPKKWRWVLPVLGMVVSAVALLASMMIAGSMAVPGARAIQPNQRLVIIAGGTIFVVLQVVCALLLFHEATRPEQNSGASDHGTVNES